MNSSMIRTSGMNKIPSVSLLLTLIQEVGHIPSMSITDVGILKRFWFPKNELVKMTGRKNKVGSLI